MFKERSFIYNFIYQSSHVLANIFRVLELPSLTDKDCYFDPGCVLFHFPNHLIHPTGYSYRNGGGRGSVVRKWIVEGACSPEGPWTTLSYHPEDDTYFQDVSDGQDKEKSFLYVIQNYAIEYILSSLDLIIYSLIHHSIHCIEHIVGQSLRQMEKRTFIPTSAYSPYTPIQMDEHMHFT